MIRNTKRFAVLDLDEITTFYHYTDEKGIIGIQETGIITATPVTARDAFLGKGVYLTSMSPDEGKREIALNNWDGSSRSTAFNRLRKGRLDFYVKIEIPLDHDKRWTILNGFERLGRDIFLFRNEDIVLDDFEYEIESFDA